MSFLIFQQDSGRYCQVKATIGWGGVISAALGGFTVPSFIEMMGNFDAARAACPTRDPTVALTCQYPLGIAAPKTSTSAAPFVVKPLCLEPRGLKGEVRSGYIDIPRRPYGVIEILRIPVDPELREIGAGDPCSHESVQAVVFCAPHASS